jgi:putative ABC transport system permease protein
MERVLHDLRHAVRALRRSPGFTLTAVLTVALGVGVPTAMFTVVDGVVLRPLPYPEPDRLLRVWSAHPERGLLQFGVSAPDALDWAGQSRSLEAVAAFERARPMTWTGAGEPAQLLVSPVTAGTFGLLGVPAKLGRTFVAGGDPHAVVISDALWQRSFGGDPAAVGRALALDGEAYTVTAVMPPRFAVPGSSAEAWTPLELRAGDDRSRRYLRVLARVRPGVAVAAARAELQTLASRLAAAHPVTNGGWSVTVWTVHDAIVGSDLRRALFILLAVVALVMLIACANVAHLVLVRAAAREREIAIRSALGAGRGRLAAQLLTESLLIAAAGGVIGVLLAGGTIDALRAAAPDALPRLDEVQLDLRAFAFAGLAALAAAALFGFVPALQSSRVEAMARALKEGRGIVGARSARLRSAIVAVEIALAVIVTTGSVLLVRSLIRLQAVDPGFDAAGVVAVPITAVDRAYPDRKAVSGFYATVLDRVRALPGVERAALVSSAPFLGPNTANLVASEGAALTREQAPDVDIRAVAGPYFETLRIPLRRGRDFDAHDTAASVPVAVVNDSMARRLWPGQDPIGRRFRLGDLAAGPWITVVGLAGDARYRNLDAETSRPMVYLPQAATGDRAMTLVVRTTVSTAAVAGALRPAIWDVDRGVPLPVVRGLEEVVAAALAPQRFNASLFAVFAALALTLSAVGVYGVMAHFVTLRRPEIGVRVALGASPRAVAAFVLRRGGAAAGVGLVAGVAGALALGPLLESLLYGVRPADPSTIAVVAGLFALVTLTASWVPARRAIRLDPVQVLRQG